MRQPSDAHSSASMNVKPGEKEFNELLHALSVVCRFDFDEDGLVASAYDRALSPLGYPRVNAALQKVFEDRRSNDPFPSVSEIKAVMQESLSAEDQAPIIAGRILEAVARIGPWQTEKFRAHVGEVGWRVVQMSGGLEPVCSIQDRDVSANRAHWTRLAMSLLRAGSAALPSDTPKPQIEGPMPEKELKSIADIIGRIPK